MRSTLRALGCAAALLALACSAQAKSWRGITPLRSTRDDVVRLLGRCDYTTIPRCEFNFDNETASVVFSGNGKYGPECLKKLPPGVVLQIDITPKTDVRLSDFYADPGKLKKIEGYTWPGAAYSDEEEGAIYHASDGKVARMVYLAARKDRPLCLAYYENPERFVTNFVSDPPVVEVTCPKTVEAGEWVTLDVTIEGADPDVTPTLSWEVTGGKIVSGQGTPSVKINPGIFEGRTIKATVIVRGYGIALYDSCEIRVIKKGKDDK